MHCHPAEMENNGHAMQAPVPPGLNIPDGHGRHSFVEPVPNVPLAQLIHALNPVVFPPHVPSGHGIDTFELPGQKYPRGHGRLIAGVGHTKPEGHGTCSED